MGHHAQLPCCISGHVTDAEYHHVFIEWAFADAVDWETVKSVALGQVTELPVLDLHTDQPTGETYPAIHSLLYTLTVLATARGFDWQAFDPARPELFVDSIANILVLHSKFHRLKDHGIHVMSMPEWVFQAWPRKSGFIFTPDEEAFVSPPNVTASVPTPDVAANNHA
jgi:hypothetical protein